MQSTITFQARSGLQLTGNLHQPDAGQPKAFALFAHCFTCTKNVKAAVNIARALSRQGIATLRFDFTGLGQSEGDFSETHFSSNIEDLLDAAGYLREQHQAPQILVGHSLGGTACLAAATRIEEVKAVVTIGSPADAEHVLGLLESDLPAIEAEGKARVKLAGSTFTIRKDFVDDVRSQSVRDGIRHLRRALLVMHSPVDEVISIDEAARIYSSALHPKSFVSLDQADHLLSRSHDSEYAGLLLAAWASRYIDNPLPVIAEADFERGAVVVTSNAENGLAVAINANGHPLLGDEPASVGGTDRGPTPYDLLSAALASCTAMTLMMYARHKKLALERVEVQVRHDKVHAEDCVDCDKRESRIDQLERRIHLWGELDTAKRQRLLEIADRCPVHKTLHGEIRVVSPSEH
jgi:putative redox protein